MKDKRLQHAKRQHEAALRRLDAAVFEFKHLLAQAKSPIVRGQLQYDIRELKEDRGILLEDLRDINEALEGA